MADYGGSAGGGACLSMCWLLFFSCCVIMVGLSALGLVGERPRAIRESDATERILRSGGGNGLQVVPGMRQDHRIKRKDSVGQVSTSLFSVHQGNTDMPCQTSAHAHPWAWEEKGFPSGDVRQMRACISGRTGGDKRLDSRRREGGREHEDGKKGQGYGFAGETRWCHLAAAARQGTPGAGGAGCETGQLNFGFGTRRGTRTFRILACLGKQKTACRVHHSKRLGGAGLTLCWAGGGGGRRL